MQNDATIIKDASYHEAAVQYNEELAVFAQNLSERLMSKHKEIARWANAVSKQHRYHEARHRKALARVQSGGLEENTEDGGEDFVLDDHNVAPKVDASPDAEQAAEPVAEQGEDRNNG